MAAEDNLLGYWLMTEATGATRADSSGNSLDLLDVGTTDMALSATSEMGDGSIDGGAVGAQHVLEIADASLPNDFPFKGTGTTADAYTVYCRIRSRSNVSGLGRRFINKTGGFSGLIISQEVANDDRDMLIRHTDAGSTHHDTTITLPDHTDFHTVIVRYQGDTDNELSTWLDAVKDGTTHTPTTMISVGQSFFVGNIGPTDARSMDALMDEAAVWARALTDAEIAVLDSSGLDNFFNAQTIIVDGLTATVTPGDVTIARGLGQIDKRGLILAAVEDTIDTIANINGYNFTYQKHHRRSMEWDQVPGSMPAILWFPGETQYESLAGVGGGRNARLRITLLGYYKREDPDSDDHSSRVLKDMERAMLRALNGSGDTHYLSNAGVEWIDWIGTEVDPYYQGEFRMGRVMLDVILNYTEKGSEIVAAS